MTTDSDDDSGASVRQAILKLLLAALATEVRASAQELVAHVIDHPEIEPHAGKKWGDLSEDQKNVIAREVGLAVRDATGGAAGDAQTGAEHLH
jgi:hypothetical protein